MPDNSKKEKKPAKVKVFNREVGEEKNFDESFERRWSGRRHHGSLTWGLFFIVIGLLFLLSNLGSLPPIAWTNILKFWPVLIILIGVDTLLGHSDAADVVNSLIALFVFLTILGVIFTIYTPQFVAGLPVGITNYLDSIVKILQMR